MKKFTYWLKSANILFHCMNVHEINVKKLKMLKMFLNGATEKCSTFPYEIARQESKISERNREPANINLNVVKGL